MSTSEDEKGNQHRVQPCNIRHANMPNMTRFNKDRSRKKFQTCNPNRLKQHHSTSRQKPHFFASYMQVHLQATIEWWFIPEVCFGWIADHFKCFLVLACEKGRKHTTSTKSSSSDVDLVPLIFISKSKPSWPWNNETILNDQVNFDKNQISQ